jgi:thiamine biosynthesis lipoprotein
MKVRPLYFFIFFLVLAIAGEMIYTRFIFSAQGSAYLMGTPVRVRVEGPNAPSLARQALAEIKRLDRLFNRFEPESEISLLNRLAGQAPLEISRDTLECLRIAQDMWGLSGGAFDVTLGYPGALVVTAAEKKVYLKKGVKIDLGALGKGYAAEAVRRLLLKKGAKSGMIDMRSSIAVFGDRDRKIGVQDPRDREKFLGTIILKGGQSLATSGDYERGEHILDPRVRAPARLCRSVTVIGKNAAETDALATAIFVLGPAQGLQLVESLPGVEALVVDRDGKLHESLGLVLEKL